MYQLIENSGSEDETLICEYETHGSAFTAMSELYTMRQIKIWDVVVWNSATRSIVIDWN